MRVLRRQAGDSALDLAVVSSSPAIRHAADQAGFPVYGSLQSYERALSRAQSASHRTRGSLARAGRGASHFGTLGVIGGITFVALAAIYLMLPQATITLVPVTQTLQEKIEIQADPNAKTVDVEKRIVPARVVYVQSEGTDQVTTSGKQASTNSKAQGQVTFTNRTDKEVTVPRGTVVRTSNNVGFTTLDDVKLGAGSQASGRTNIAALEAGSQGNVERGAINKADGDINKQVGVFNEQPTTGGGSKEVETVTDQDKAALKDTLTKRLQADVLRKLEAERQRHETLSPESIRIVTLKEDYDQNVGGQSKVLNLSMQLRANGTFYNMADVEQVIKAWSPRLKPGYYLRPDTIKASEPRIVNAEGGTARIEVNVEGVVASRINEDRVTEGVRWKSVDEIKRYLNTLVLAKDPEIVIQPGWASKAIRVQIIVKNPDGTSAPK
jgi:hypothetical protein